MAAALVTALRVHGPVVVPGRVGRAGLERAERTGHPVLVVAGDACADARRHDFCRRQADRVVLVVEPFDEVERLPSVPDAEVLHTGPRPGRDRILAVLARTGARRVHVLADGGLEDLAARLTHRSLGLALAGGGARALAHLGVVAELAAAGVRVHRVAGVSMGAYIASVVAAGWSFEQLMTIAREEFVVRRPFGDWTVPRTALSRGERPRAAARRAFGELVAEELPRELVVVATDLRRREQVWLREGRVGVNAVASGSLPGMVPPVVLGKRVLVDGAVLGNLPVAPLLEPDVGPVLAVDITAGGGGSGGDRTGPPRVPPLAETLMRSLLLGGAESDARARARADVVVTPALTGVGLLEFHQLDVAVEAGRAAGRAAVEALAALSRSDPPASHNGCRPAGETVLAGVPG